MPREIAEADWKVFRQLREVALRFCERVLTEAKRVCKESTASAHKRYLELYRLIEECDEELAQAFNDARRSTALLQLAIIQSHELLTAQEVARFSDDVQKSLASIQEVRES